MISFVSSSRFKSQRGVSLTGLLAASVVVGALALVGMRVVPTIVEYQNIRKALVRAVSSTANGNPDAIRNAFDRSQAIDDFSAISGKDLLIEKRPNDQTHVSFAYEKRIPLLGPVSLVIDYQGDAGAR
ncbi:MAG: DUF4845 domain-containing protein [Lautropia sp.]|nr:DUF4845 domain-containing protein [Lautropia sp.]